MSRASAMLVGLALPSILISGNPFQKFGGSHVQSFSHRHKGFQGQVSLTTLNRTHVGPMYFADVGKAFLGIVPLSSQLADSIAQFRLDLLHFQEFPRMLYKRLQT